MNRTVRSGRSVLSAAQVNANMPFTIIEIHLTPNEEMTRDLLISELSDVGFEGFLETDSGFEAYLEQSLFDESAMSDVLNRFREQGTAIVTSMRSEEDRNWNEEWERNFDPVEVGDLFRIRAPFHEQKEGFGLEITIMPKMSFGTGHHSTTAGMIELLMTHTPTSPLLDMGSGTAVLAIVAHKLGAQDITAIDIDEWAFENAPENCALNGISDIEVLQGDASLLEGRSFSTILANINRNVLLEDIRKYVTVLTEDGHLFLSGFYTEDLQIIQEEAERNGLVLRDHLVRNNWVSAFFTKG
jgi:ribosomal protein L11 methyltransferase